MVEKEIQFVKKREPGEIISDSFQFLKQEKGNISRLIVKYVLPFIILYSLTLVYFQKNIISRINFQDTENLAANIGPVYFNVFLFSLFGLFVQSLLIGTYYSYIEIYIKKGKSNFDIEDVTSVLFENGLLALKAGIFMFILVMLGLIFCILPGLYLANTLSITAFIFIFEKKGLGIAVRRSVFFVNSQWWNTLILNVLGIVMIWGIGFVFTIPTLLAGVTDNILENDTSRVLPEWYWYWIGLSSVVSSVLWIIPYTFLAFQYFNIDERTKSVNPPTV